MEKQFAKAESKAASQHPTQLGSPEIQASSHIEHPISDSEEEGQDFSPDHALGNPGSLRPFLDEDAGLFDCPLEIEEEQIPVRPLVAKPSIAPSTAGTHPVENQGPSLSAEM